MRLLAIRVPITLVLGCTTAAVAAPVPPPPEMWVYVCTDKGAVAIRVGGGPPRQVETKMPMREDGAKWVPAPDQFSHEGLLVDDGKRLLYVEEDPATRGKEDRDRRSRLMIADAERRSPKLLMTGLEVNAGRWSFSPAPDGKSVVCGAERGGKWDVYRVAFDGSAPVKISQTPGIVPAAARHLPDGRVVYQAATGRKKDGHVTSPEGPVFLTDGKTETLLVKNTTEGLPDISPDASKMAAITATAQGETAIEVTDLKTGTVEQFPLSAFHKDWTCKFWQVRFSPDGKALAVTFFLGYFVLRDKGPLPGDEAVQHVAVLWLDGRKNRISLHPIDPRVEHSHYPDVEWGPPGVRK